MCLDSQSSKNAEFAIVCPSPALDISEEGEAVPVSPEMSLKDVLREKAEDFKVIRLKRAAMAVSLEDYDTVSTYVCEDTAVIFTGELENTEYLQKKHGPSTEDGSGPAEEAAARASPAEVVALAYRNRKYTFLSSLRGSFAFILYDIGSGNAFAARDASGMYPLYQGRDRTGGILITNTVFEGADRDLIDIQPATFIFGRKPGRNLHKFASTPDEFEASKREASMAALRALGALPRTPSTASPNKAATPSTASPNRAVEQNCSTNAITKKNNTPWRPSPKSIADRVDSWRHNPPQSPDSDELANRSAQRSSSQSSSDRSRFRSSRSPESCDTPSPEPTKSKSVSNHRRFRRKHRSRTLDHTSQIQTCVTSCG